MDYCEIVNKEVIELIFKILFMMLMLIAALCDIRDKKIPISLPASIMFLSIIYWLYLWSINETGIMELIISFVPGSMLTILSYISGKSIGIGDGLMVLSLGPFLGILNLMLTIMISFTFSAILGGILLIMKRVNGKSTMAFIPFLTAGMGVTCFVFV